LLPQPHLRTFLSLITYVMAYNSYLVFLFPQSDAKAHYHTLTSLKELRNAASYMKPGRHKPMPLHILLSELGVTQTIKVGLSHP
jgi:hypothetical protein